MRYQRAALWKLRLHYTVSLLFAADLTQECVHRHLQMACRVSSDIGVRIGKSLTRLPSCRRDRTAREFQLPLFVEQALNLAHAQVILASHQSNRGYQPWSHLPARNVRRRLGLMATSTAPAAAAEQLMLGQQIAYEGQVEDLMSHAWLSVHDDGTAAAAAGIREVALAGVTQGFVRFVQRPFVLCMSGLSASVSIRWRLGWPAGALSRGVRGRWHRAVSGVLAAFLRQELGKLRTEFVVAGLLLLEFRRQFVDKLPQRIDLADGLFERARRGCARERIHRQRRA